ncbi:TetR/AcrR family transcriptional regulator [Streptomyces sp. NPDC059455]|uniref:TetR/AcrR family transcriptional regulator n=1 Tax=Streptomyces sp. NPDC059455 TaxID=3346837 RepID=UPI00367C604F
MEKLPPGTGTPTGRRERKKAATRAAIAAAALHLFLERGFDAVSIRDIAERADVAVATVFAHFPGKEALVFDEDETIANSLVDAVESRPPGTDALTALQEWFTLNESSRNSRQQDPRFTEFWRLVEGTPALHAYWKQMWRLYIPLITQAIERTTDVGPRSARLTAALVVEGHLLASADDDPGHMLELLFTTLRSGLPSSGTARAG